MDFQAFLDMLSGRPTNANASVGEINRGRQAQDSRQAQEYRAGDRKLYRSRIEAANLGAPEAPPSDLYSILMANQGAGAAAPELADFRQAGQEHVAQAQDMAANAQSDYAAAQMLPPPQTLGPETVQMSAFQPDAPAAAATPPMAGPTKSIEFLGLPPPAPRPPAPGPMPQMEQMSKPLQPVPNFNRIPPVIGPGGVDGPHFIPPEALAFSRQPQPIAPLRPQPQGPVIGPGGVTGANDPFRPVLSAGAPAPVEAPAPVPGIQQQGWLAPPQGAPPLRPRQAPAPAQPEVTADELNRAELNRLLASFDTPAPSQPPPTPAAPAPDSPRTVADSGNGQKPIGPMKMNEAMPDILKEQLLSEAIRLTRKRREANVGAQ